MQGIEGVRCYMRDRQGQSGHARCRKELASPAKEERKESSVCGSAHGEGTEERHESW